MARTGWADPSDGSPAEATVELTRGEYFVLGEVAEGYGVPKHLPRSRTGTALWDSVPKSGATANALSEKISR